MLEFYNIKPKGRKKAISMFSSIPFIGLLNIAVSQFCLILVHAMEHVINWLIESYDYQFISILTNLYLVFRVGNLVSLLD
jgi:hypothetical protein